MTLSDEKRVWCYRLTTAGLLVVAAFALLSALVPGPFSTNRFSPRARILYVEYECFVSAVLAVAIIRLKSTVAAEKDSRETDKKNLDFFKVGSRWAAFRKVGDQLWIEPGKPQRVPKADSQALDPKKAASPPVQNYDNDGLARRAASELRRTKPD